ncbi:MAG: PilZ domain-containing protein [Gemmatimonadetes bacterium]|nr:PilZ domain-containing protein [Gemmatimonadota bacterium]MBT4612202.1 PilZ domain-containing protein [Gemmatimonadota bacterium]MBT5058562.1 PilZ domain-containing protein [Gemmatimonadota bacterium]MBT5141124.1 PilZ domain-containing protein [Gemmatimonadota bacterium]MBT5591943.1 PilZ domain-containing protein [Gemmatimonadota bacterium]
MGLPQKIDTGTQPTANQMAVFGQARWISLAWVFGVVTAVQALDRDGMWRQMGSTVRSDEKADVTWFLAAFAALVIVVFFVTRLVEHQHQRRAVSGGRSKLRRTFSQQAGAMGFRPVEISNLRRIASRLSGGSDPLNVLSTNSGRQFLTADLRKRIRRREREIEMLDHILQKLGTAGRGFHERAGIRVETDISIWLVHRGEDNQGADDEIVIDIAPIAARLFDLSEAGAAICANTELSPGDIVEFWSGDPQYWIPPTQSGVVSVRPTKDGTRNIGLHFLDPPRTEIRRVIQEIQRHEREDLDQILHAPESPTDS